MRLFRAMTGSRLAIAITAVIVTSLVVAGGLAGALPGTKSVKNNDIGNGAVNSRTIKNNNIKSKDIRNNTIQGKDIRDGTITAADLAPDTLTTGPAGIDGTDGGVSVSASQIAMLQWCPGSKVDYDTGTNPCGVAFDGTNIWITNQGSSTVSKMVTAN